MGTTSKILRTGVGLIALLLSACTTVDPNVKYYEPPPGTTPDNGATITGSRVSQSFPFDDQTAYVLGVSGQPVRGGKAAFSEPIVLPPGFHNIAIAWTQGTLLGHATIRVNVNSGDRIVIKHQRVEAQVARLWLEDAKTNAVIGEAVLVSTIAPTSGGNMPIFIPRKR
jgi:hypothetical protein